MTDVTAIILTIGESTTQRAIESVKSQSLQPCEILVIDHVFPFHRAMTQAIEKVQSTFFVQVDADMILDQNCFAVLRKCMEPQVGLVVGHLRDPLLKRVVGVKMYRTSCLQRVSFTDCISPDTEVQKELIALGWSSVRALNFSRSERWSWHTFGEHRPEYTPHYTYSKFLLEGRRYRYRENVNAFKHLLRLLQKSEAEVAIIAQVALAHGIFSVESGDGLKPFVGNDEWHRFKIFLHGESASGLLFFTTSFYLLLAIRYPFKAFYRLGIALRQADAFGTFRKIMRVLGAFPFGISWMPIVALCHGAVSLQDSVQDYEEAANAFKEFRALQRPISNRQTNLTRLAGIGSKLFHFFAK